MVGGNDGLKELPLRGIAAEEDFGVIAGWVDDVNGERMAGIKMPEFIGGDTVEGGKVFAIEEKVDGGGGGGAIGFAIVAAFGVRLQMEFFDQR